MKTVAHYFLDTLPRDSESPERAAAFRHLFAQAAESEEHRQLLCAVYDVVAENGVERYSLHDAQMFVSAVTERIELLPLVENYIERFLRGNPAANQQIRGLWRYVRELHRINLALRTVNVSRTASGGPHRNVDAA